MSGKSRFLIETTQPDKQDLLKRKLKRTPLSAFDVTNA